MIYEGLKVLLFIGVCTLWAIATIFVKVLICGQYNHRYCLFTEYVREAVFWAGLAIYLVVWEHDHFISTVWFMLAGYYAGRAWKNRPRGKGKKIAKLIGEKSRAAIQKLVDALTPNPGGAPA